MFSYRQKVRNKHVTEVWKGSGGWFVRGSRATLCVQVEDVGDPVTLTIHRAWSLFAPEKQEIGMEPGEVFSVDLSSVRRVTAHSSRQGDSFLNCAVLPAC